MQNTSSYSSFLLDVQQQVADILNSDSILSSVGFIAEDSRSVDYEIKQHLGKQGIVGLVMTPKAQFIGNYMTEMLAWDLPELVVEVVENVTVNRGLSSTNVTGQSAAMLAFDVLCHPLSGHAGQFSPVDYEQGEDGGLLVNKVTLRCSLYRDAPAPAPTEGGKFTADFTDYQGNVVQLTWNEQNQQWTGSYKKSSKVEVTMIISYEDDKWTLAMFTTLQSQIGESSQPDTARELTFEGDYSLVPQGSRFTWSE